ncbi:hypothetical protein ABEV00_12620 [Paenibacillus thiaminolyticus]
MTWKPIKILPQHTFMQSTNGDKFEFVRMKYTREPEQADRGIAA